MDAAICFAAILVMSLLCSSIFLFLEEHPRPRGAAFAFLHPHSALGFWVTAAFNVFPGIVNVLIVGFAVLLPFLWSPALSAAYRWYYPLGLLQPRTYAEWLEYRKSTENNDANATTATEAESNDVY